MPVDPVNMMFSQVKTNIDAAMGEWFLLVTVILTISVLLFAVDRILLLYVEWQESITDEPGTASILAGSGFYRFYQYRKNGVHHQIDDEVDFVSHKPNKSIFDGYSSPSGSPYPPDSEPEWHSKEWGENPRKYL